MGSPCAPDSFLAFTFQMLGLQAWATVRSLGYFCFRLRRLGLRATELPSKKNQELRDSNQLYYYVAINISNVKIWQVHRYNGQFIITAYFLSQHSLS